MRNIAKYKGIAFGALVLPMALIACGPAGNVEGWDWPRVSLTGKADSPYAASASVEVTRVWYGGTVADEFKKVILPEGVELTNTGDHNVDLYGWSLTDLTEGGSGRWAGEAIVGFYKHILLQPGQSLIIANHHHVTVLESTNGYSPISFEAAYNIEPDYTIGHIGTTAPIREAKGQFRLAHESYTWDNYTQSERVWLLRASDLTLAELALHLESNTLPLEQIAYEYPAPKLRIVNLAVDIAAATATTQLTGAPGANLRVYWGLDRIQWGRFDTSLDATGAHQAVIDLDQAALDALAAGAYLWVRAHYTSPAGEVGPWNVTYASTP